MSRLREAGETTSWLAAAGVSLAVLALAGCGAKAQDDDAAPPPPVTVAQPLVQPVEEWSEHTGRFVAAQSVDVRPRVSGYLQQIHFTDGQYVQKGQLLFTIDPLPLQAQVDRAKADVGQAEARLARAQSEFDRAQALREADAISAEEFDARREAVAQSKSAKAAAQAALRANDLDLGYTRVYAPISGRISDRRVDGGNLVQAGQTVLTTIVSLDPIHFEFSAPEALLSGAGGPALTPGAPREVALKLEGESDFAHHGKLDFVDNRIDPSTGTIRGRAVFQNKGEFTPGQYGRVRLLAAASGPSVLLPEAAINTDQSRKYVLVVNAKNLVEYRPVELGTTYQGLRVIRSGLKGGERVVVNGLQRAIPGQPVKPEFARPAREAAAAQAKTAG
ncbi:efflux RND transporter periplasmic adaptor subunit [Caulobacter sp. 17J80-11]|uniref:efflux RND transporter periplasmic adaptor subunit n=1 Tax=Caulobacter sp. 17J80-11 TaxID=2763502 RepID=UPI0016536ED3|nr:efflux RND transporter periplasmic adaptor subunit [Caulobacter sp. 17J80-11]MBC6982074.1 efflux RND transporter periplasmic adaptor subunit [Caulobacter sp. 17J80-11]